MSASDPASGRSRTPVDLAHLAQGRRSLTTCRTQVRSYGVAGRVEPRARKDVGGYDALAWALLGNDRPLEAVTVSAALAFGTRDATLIYHADMFDPAGAIRALATLERLP